MKEAIRLTNKTAIALRKSAKNVRTAYFVAAVIVSVLLCALGVFLGFIWLPAVPIMIVLIALIDSGLMVFSRGRYLSMIAQAICTEASARQMRENESASKRRDQVKNDMQRVKAAIREDVQKAEAMAHRPQGAKPFFEGKEEEQEDDDLLPPSAPRRRRAQERQEKPLQLIKGEH